jgi:hypothetical protein
LILWSGFLKSAVIVARNRKRARLNRLLKRALKTLHSREVNGRCGRSSGIEQAAFGVELTFKRQLFGSGDGLVMAGVVRSRTAASWQRNSQKTPVLSGDFGEVRMPGLGRIQPFRPGGTFEAFGRTARDIGQSTPFRPMGGCSPPKVVTFGG